MQIHVVKEGESLWDLSHQFGIAMEQIVNINQLEMPGKLVVGQALIIPTLTPVSAKPVIDVNAYTINTGESGAEELDDVGEDLTFWMPFAYRMTVTGGLEAIDDSAMIQEAIDEQIVPVLCITNFSATEAGSTLAHTILSNNDIQERLLTTIIDLMKEKGYRGINIDFENVLPADRVLYNQFLQLTVDRLHPMGYFVSTALAPKVSGEQKGLLYEAHDYEAHGRIVDFVVLMTYEWGYRLGPPQAISPLNQIKRVLDYAVTVIPRDKIFFGFQIYARDWVLPHVPGSEAETFSQQEAMRRAVEHDVAIQYNVTAQSPFFRYADEQGQTHEVWFEDARSAQAKLIR